MTGDATEPRAYEGSGAGLERGADGLAPPPEGQDTDAAIEAATEALRFCGPDRCVNAVPCSDLCWLWRD